MPVRLRDFSGLIFCYFFIKEKVVASAAISGPEHSLSCTTKRLPRRSTTRPALAPRNDNLIFASQKQITIFVCLSMTIQF
jgi:hypothetical protein